MDKHSCFLCIISRFVFSAVKLLTTVRWSGSQELSFDLPAIIMFRRCYVREILSFIARDAQVSNKKSIKHG